MYLLGKTLLNRLARPRVGLKLSTVFSAHKTKIQHNIKQFCSKAAAAEVAFSNVLPKGQRLVGYWLLSTAGLISGIVVLGGVTRLTESGLSMVEWNLIKDMRAPQTEEEWQREFEKYQEFPEYKHKSDVDKMTLEEFKRIFYYEFYHRLVGRFIGTWFLLPAAWFWARGYLNRSTKIRVGVLSLLMIGQGAMGWYMVKSGLKESETVPRVSPYRLSSHLGLALLLLAGSLWSGLSLLLPQVRIPESARYAAIRRVTHPLLTLVFITAMSGAFVAGNDAGLHYNSWPKMADRWVPTDLISEYIHPAWRNVFENPTMVQFNHRHLGELTFAATIAFYLAARRIPGLPPRARMALNSLLAISCIQFGLGITTLLMFVPVHLAATHQGGSVALLSSALWFAHEIRRWRIPIK